MAATLGARRARRDGERFVGREVELALLDRLLEDDPPYNVVHVHGPGGIGKSALLRAVARRGAEHGLTPVVVEGRELAPVPDALRRALAPATALERPLVLVDTFERISGLDGHLRRDLMPELPAGAVVVVAGRGAPDVGWWQDGWEHLTLDLPLGGLPEDDARALLRARGRRDGEDADAIRWAGGSPLALILLADAGGPAPRERRGGATGADALGMLVQRLVGGEGPVHAGALAVAAIARTTTPALLADVLPDGDAQAAWAWLASRTFAEPLGDGLAPHDLVRRAALAELRARDPDRERDLRRRIADHLAARAREGRPLLSIDLAHLVQDPVLRWGYSWEGADRYRVDDLRPGDAAAIRGALAARGRAAIWAATEPLLAAPGLWAVARDVEDRVCGYTIAATPRTASAAARADPLLGPWLARAAALAPDGQAVVWHSSVDLSGDALPRVQAMLGVAGILRSDVPNPRLAFLPVNREVRGAAEFSAAVGAVHEPTLDRVVGGHTIECHVLDYGPGGLLGRQRATVHAETGGAAGGAGAAGPVVPDPEVVEHLRAALRDLHRPARLARSPLADGTTVHERAASVRALVVRAADATFGDAPAEQALRAVLDRAYLAPAGSHELAARALYVSRATYFRRLREAVDRLAEQVAAERLAGDADR